MPTDSEVATVVAAIAANEGSPSDGFHCNNETIVGVTDLDAPLVATILGELWQADRIEGVLTIGGGVKPHLEGIVRVLSGRQRVWKSDGYYQPQP